MFRLISHQTSNFGNVFSILFQQFVSEYIIMVNPNIFPNYHRTVVTFWKNTWLTKSILIIRELFNEHRVKLTVKVLESSWSTTAFLYGGNLSNGNEVGLVKFEHLNIFWILYSRPIYSFFFLLGSQVEQHQLFSPIQKVDCSFGVDHHEVLNILIQLYVADDFLPEVHDVEPHVILTINGVTVVEHDEGGVEGGVEGVYVDAVRELYRCFWHEHLLSSATIIMNKYRIVKELNYVSYCLQHNSVHINQFSNRMKYWIFWYMRNQIRTIWNSKIKQCLLEPIDYFSLTLVYPSFIYQTYNPIKPYKNCDNSV